MAIRRGIYNGGIMSELTNEEWRGAALDSWQRMGDVVDRSDDLFKSLIKPIGSLNDDGSRMDIMLPSASLRLIFPLSGDDQIFWENGEEFGTEAMTPENICSRYLWIWGLALKEKV